MQEYTSNKANFQTREDCKAQPELQASLITEVKLSKPVANLNNIKKFGSKLRENILSPLSTQINAVYGNNHSLL
jgi:hypothetical protein